jgi:putative DNA primase/helicase
LADAVHRAVLDRGAKRQPSGEWRMRCPAHDDHRPSADWSPGRGVWVCRSCGAGGGAVDLAERLGVELPRRAAGRPPAAATAKVTVYAIRDAAGEVVAEHVRTDAPGAGKRYTWRRSGRPGLNGLPVAVLPLYRSEHVATVDRSRPVFVVEGEKAADALAATGVQVVATVTGASSTPGAEALVVLAGLDVMLWPDADAVGWSHMQRVAARLAGVARSVRVWSPAGLPPGGDAVEWLASVPGATSAEVEATAEREATGAAVEAPAVEVTGPAPPPAAVCLADVEPETVRWLWPLRIPLGKLTNLEGDPGQGKSYITAALATALSLGRGLPDADTPEGETLFFTAEDGLGDTLRPRLDAMGADVRRVHAVDVPLDLSPGGSGLAAVEREVERLRPLLVVVDPVVAYIGGRTDAHRANEVRAILAPLAKLAETYGCAVLSVRHLSKGRSGRAMHAGAGSVDFTAAARSVLLAGSVADDSGARAIVQTKSNLGPLAPALGYSIEGGRFDWCGASTLTAADLLGSEDSSEDRGALADAEEFLRDLLADGPCPAADALKKARAEGIAERTLKRARRRLGIVARKTAFAGSWEWLPPQGGQGDHEEGQEGQGKLLAPLGACWPPSAVEV